MKDVKENNMEEFTDQQDEEIKQILINAEILGNKISHGQRRKLKWKYKR